MNILYLCDEYPPARTGGIGTATKIIAEGLAQQGHKVYVISARIVDDLPKESVIGGVIVYRFFAMTNMARILYGTDFFSKSVRFLLGQAGYLASHAVAEYYRYRQFVDSIISENNIQIVEIPDYSIFSKYYNSSHRPKYRPYSIPSIARVHGSRSFLEYYNCGKMSCCARDDTKSFLEAVDRIVAVSHFSASFVNVILGVNNRCDVVYNPLTIVSNGIANTKREKNIVFIGKIIKTKGAYNLIKAFNLFSRKHSDYSLILIGGGDIAYAKKLIDTSILSKVKFTGYLDPEDVSNYLSSASFCVIPSFFETFGITAIEAMSMGNILIYTNTSSGPELIEDGNNGFLVNPYDVLEIYEKMKYIAENMEMLQGMRERARQSVNSRFSKEIIIDKMFQIYLETVIKNK